MYKHIVLLYIDSESDLQGNLTNEIFRNLDFTKNYSLHS
jgi:hypothetical protein